MTRFKSFGSPLINTSDPVEFELYGTIFRCRASIQGRTLLNFLSRSSEDDGAGSAGAMMDFLDGCILPEQRDKFSEMTSSDDMIIPMATLTEITTWLIEVYSGNSLEEPSNPSLNGQKTTPSSSEVTPLPTESTSVVSAPAI